ETMGRQKQFGIVDEVARLVEECVNVSPVIDFAHIHARTNGGLKTKEDFKVILDRFDGLGVSPIHCHMTGIKYRDGNEKHHLAISSFEPDFRLLAEVLIENSYNTTIICESPLMEQDALLFKKWITNQTKL
ncbi:MAG: endonuclease IV, partial [Candidatus Aenigmarchaeota archaeon]|nr:endonuclease IV [Candidatus Aenigmarchaeota archaeon]